MRLPKMAPRAGPIASLTVMMILLAPLSGGLPPPTDGGAMLWEGRHDGGTSDGGRAIAVHPSGLLVYATGHSMGASQDFATIAHEALTGLPVWTAIHDGAAGGSDFANAIGVDPAGARVYVTGYSNSAATSNDVKTIAYDALTGVELWTANHDGPASGSDVPYALAVDPAGNRVYVTGGSAGVGSSTDYLTIAYDAATGAELWQARYDGPASAFDIPWAIAVAPAGESVYVTGQGRGDSPDITTIAYESATGDTQWVARHDGPAASFDNANDLTVSPDGAFVYVAGYTRGLTTSNDLTVIAHDAATGAEAWTTRYDGPVSGADYANAVTVSPDGARVFATGYSWGGSATRSDWPVVALDAATGATDWVVRHDGPASGLDVAEAIAPNGNGTRVHITGYSTDSNNDYALVTLDAASGDEVWQARYDGAAGGTDRPTGLAVDPLGIRVYVTGQSAGPGTGTDFATLAYVDALPTLAP